MTEHTVHWTDNNPLCNQQGLRSGLVLERRDSLLDDVRSLHHLLLVDDLARLAQRQSAAPEGAPGE